MTSPSSDHEWKDSEVSCEDCGTHPAVICINPEHNSETIDLIYHSDPRETELCYCGHPGGCYND